MDEVTSTAILVIVSLNLAIMTVACVSSVFVFFSRGHDSHNNFEASRIWSLERKIDLLSDTIQKMPPTNGGPVAQILYEAMYKVKKL